MTFGTRPSVSQLAAPADWPDNRSCLLICTTRCSAKEDLVSDLHIDCMNDYDEQMIVTQQLVVVVYAAKGMRLEAELAAWKANHPSAHRSPEVLAKLREIAECENRVILPTLTIQRLRCDIEYRALELRILPCE